MDNYDYALDVYQNILADLETKYGSEYLMFVNGTEQNFTLEEVESYFVQGNEMSFMILWDTANTPVLSLNIRSPYTIAITTDFIEA